jgi:hypothetical protein
MKFSKEITENELASEHKFVKIVSVTVTPYSREEINI